MRENGEEEHDSDSGTIGSTELEESDDDEGENEPLCIDESKEENKEPLLSMLICCLHLITFEVTMTFMKR